LAVEISRQPGDGDETLSVAGKSVIVTIAGRLGKKVPVLWQKDHKIMAILRQYIKGLSFLSSSSITLCRMRDYHAFIHARRPIYEISSLDHLGRAYGGSAHGVF
jgi:hypothetical protein